MSKVRKKRLHAILKSCFALDDLAIDQLIEDSAEIDRTAIDLYHFTRQLNKVLDDQVRRHVIQMMWEIVCADGKVSPLEDNIIWRAADLLGVSSRQRVELRQQVSADSAVLLAIILPNRTHRRQPLVTESIVPIDPAKVPSHVSLRA